MHKNYNFQTAGTNSPLSWTVTMRSPDNINMKLSCANREIFGISKEGQARYYPLMSGEDIATGNTLTLELSSNKDYELTFSSYHNLMNDGELIGYTHICNGTREGEDGKKVTFQLEINSFADTVKWDSDEAFIAYAYSLYLQYKDKIVMNYITNEYVGEYANEMQTYDSKLVFSNWYLTKLASIKTVEEHRALIFAILKVYDDMVSGQGDEYLRYVEYNNLLLVLGKKQWREDRTTLGSCPFQSIRGILLNNTELKQFNSIHGKIGNATLFDSNGLLTASASHASPDVHLGMDATRGLNFRNVGIHVYEGADVEKVETIIKKSVDSSSEAKILIFPELFINSNKIAYLTDCLNQKSADSQLELVVAGSYYKPTGSQYTNTTTLLAKDSNGKWNELGEYNKVFPFSMGYSESVAQAYGFNTNTYPPSHYDLLLEDLQLDGSITLLGYKDCVVGVAICRDAMDLLDARNPLHRYCDFADLMLVISDNSGQSNMFVGVAECLSRWHNCAMLYTNAVNEAADETAAKFLEISFGIYPYKRRTSTGSTSLSGVLSYKGELFVQANNGDTIIPSLGILNSAGIHYEKLSNEELDNCVKIYTFKNFNNQNK